MTSNDIIKINNDHKAKLMQCGHTFYTIIALGNSVILFW